MTPIDYIDQDVDDPPMQWIVTEQCNRCIKERANDPYVAKCIRYIKSWLLGDPGTVGCDLKDTYTNIDVLIITLLRRQDGTKTISHSES